MEAIKTQLLNYPIKGIDEVPWDGEIENFDGEIESFNPEDICRCENCNGGNKMEDKIVEKAMQEADIILNVKEIYVEAAKSKNFQKYTVGMTIEIKEDQNFDEVTKKAQAKCRQLAQKEIDLG